MYMSPIGNFFRKEGRAVGNFFKKGASMAGTAIRNMGSAIGLGARQAVPFTSGASKGLGLAAGIAGLVAPEFAVPLGLAALGTKAIDLGTQSVASASRGQKVNALEKAVGSAQTGQKLFR